MAVPLDAVRRSNRRNRELAIYAKTGTRVRFEVRYFADLPDAINAGASAGPERLAELLLSARRDAHEQRLNWSSFAQIMDEAEAPEAASLILLADIVRQEVVTRGGDFRTVLESLLLTGGLSSSGASGISPERLCQALVRRGVLSNVRLVANQRGPGRYPLDPAYRSLRRALREARGGHDGGGASGGAG